MDTISYNMCTIWSTDKRVLHLWRKTWSILSTISRGNGPGGACRSSQCLSPPGWRLKLGHRGAFRPANLRENCGAGVKGEWQAGGAIMAKNGRFFPLSPATPDKEDWWCDGMIPSIKSNASLAYMLIPSVSGWDVNNKISQRKNIHYYITYAHSFWRDLFESAAAAAAFS